MGLFELADYYTEHFSDVVSCKAPKNKYVDIFQSYFNKGLEYFNNFDLDLDQYEVLGVEKEVRFKLDGYDFIGFIDLLLRDKETGEITILDHKSASIKILKNGNISKSDQQHFREFVRQLMLYSKAVMEEYGRVDYLEWNMFKDMNRIKIPWTPEDYDEATKWAIDTIHDIEKETEWNPSPDQFFCCNLCGLDFCEYR